MRRVIGWIVTILLVSNAAALAQASVTLGGEVRARFGVAADGSLPVAAAQLELDAKGETGSGLFPDASFNASLLARYDAAAGTSEVRLGDAYATLYLGDLELSLGQQTVSWGTTVGINPVDMVNPQDRSVPPESDKLPVPMLHGSYYAGDVATIEAVLVPVFIPSTAPSEAWQPSRASPQAAGVPIVGRLPIQNVLPATEVGNVQFGVRATVKLEALDVSATYFHGFRSLPTVQTTLKPGPRPGTFVLQPIARYDRVDVVGIDASAVVQDVVLRGEAAYTFTADPNGIDPAIGNPSWQAVAGGEYAFPGGPRAIVQGVLDVDEPDAGEDPKARFKTMTMLSYQPTARTQIDLGWMQNLDGSGSLQPRLSYTFADGVVGHTDGYVFYGADGTEFGGWRGNTQLRLGLAYSF